MKNINKRSNIKSRRAFKKSVHTAERQEGKKVVTKSQTYNPFEFRHGFDDCSCYSCQDQWLDYLPFVATGTIGGRFIETLVKLNITKSWKDYSGSYRSSDLYYHVKTTPDGIISSTLIK